MAAAPNQLSQEGVTENTVEHARCKSDFGN